MGRENKKDSVAALHREQILKAAGQLFSQKGYEQTTIADLSEASGYSRRTIYAYFESKEEMLYHLIEKGLQALKAEIEDSVSLQGDFVTRYKAICQAMRRYQKNHPHSVAHVNNANAASLEGGELSETAKRILLLGTEINRLLTAFLQAGKESGMVRRDVVPALSVFVLWSGITSLLTLAETKGAFLCSQFSISEDQLLDYGFQQLINSILEVRISDGLQ